MMAAASADLELGFWTNENVLRTVSRHIVRTIERSDNGDEKHVLGGEKIRTLAAINSFDGREMGVKEFLQKWEDALPVDFCGDGLSDADIKNPFFRIKDRVFMIRESDMPRDPVKRLESIFKLSPLWEGETLIELITPIMPEGTKVG